jgi:hypothetical protein
MSSSSSSSSYPFKFEGRGTFIDVPGYGRQEVQPGSEDFVQNVLAKYMGATSVKVTRAPNYVGRYGTTRAATSSSTSGGAAKRTK